MIFLLLGTYFDLLAWMNHHSQSALQLPQEFVPIGSNWGCDGGVFKYYLVCSLVEFEFLFSSIAFHLSIVICFYYETY